jgi:hypothetical protein
LEDVEVVESSFASASLAERIDSMHTLRESCSVTHLTSHGDGDGGEEEDSDESGIIFAFAIS